MTKIYIDTNIFMDFYQTAEDPLTLLDSLGEFSEHMVTTEQTGLELLRNRDAVLRSLIKRLEESVETDPHTTSILKHLPEHGELIRLRKEMKEKAKLMVGTLREMIDKLCNDPVAEKYFGLLRGGNITLYKSSEEIIRKAHTRKLLGHPPFSKDKQTIGDEVIWETLLANLSDDLAIVTRDKTFHDYVGFMKHEYLLAKRRKLLLVTKRVSEALKLVGHQPSERLIEEERHLEEAKKKERARNLADIREAAEKKRLKDEQEVRFVPPPGGFLPCPRCGKIGPWDSVKCHTCGFMDST